MNGKRIYTEQRIMRRNTGFTLVEITVVLAIAALVSAITLSGFKSVSTNNARVSCQTNLVQIYQACRLYAADETGDFPYRNEAGTSVAGSRNIGIGLWALQTFPSDTNSDVPAPIPPDNTDPAYPLKPTERYLRTIKVLHCPADNLDSSHEFPTILDPTDSTFKRKLYNPTYLSYQGTDDKIPTTESNLNRGLYQSLRTVDDSAANRTSNNPIWMRQLLHYTSGTTTSSPESTKLEVRPPTDDTVVTYCQHHRTTRSVPHDNVLFYDGTVRFIRSDPTIATFNWQRTPATQ